MIFVAAIIFTFFLQQVTAGKEHIAGACHDPLYFGNTPCDKTWSIRYFMDVSTETCLAFNFTGCGDNWNNFATSQACYEECLPLDHHKCPAASKIHKTTKGRTTCSDDCDCGVERYCDIGQGHGQCCEQEYKELPSHCAVNPNMEKTKNCTKNPELKFHFDAATGFCMNFLWDGCSKNENKFNNTTDCTSSCLKDNYKGCPFRRNPLIVSNCHHSNECNVLNRVVNSFYCTRQGICCETKDLEELRNAFNVTCPSGGQKVQYTYKSTMRLLIGKTCNSNMCPMNATCHQNEYFAFCCQ